MCLSPAPLVAQQCPRPTLISGRAARYALAPATATAPAGSRMVRVSENTSLIAALIAALSTCAASAFWQSFCQAAVDVLGVSPGRHKAGLEVLRDNLAFAEPGRNGILALHGTLSPAHLGLGQASLRSSSQTFECYKQEIAHASAAEPGQQSPVDIGGNLGHGKRTKSGCTQRYATSLWNSCSAYENITQKGKLAAKCHGAQHLWCVGAHQQDAVEQVTAQAEAFRPCAGTAQHQRKCPTCNSPFLCHPSLFAERGGRVSSGTVFCCSRSTCDLTTALRLTTSPIVRSRRTLRHLGGPLLHSRTVLCKHNARPPSDHIELTRVYSSLEPKKTVAPPSAEHRDALAQMATPSATTSPCSHRANGELIINRSGNACTPRSA